MLFQPVLLGELHGNGQSGLSAQSGQQAVRFLFLDDSLYGFHRQRLQIDFVRQVFIRHDGGRVGVHQHRIDALLLQHPAGLGAGIVKFRRLADDNRSGTDY